MDVNERVKSPIYDLPFDRWCLTADVRLDDGEGLDPELSFSQESKYKFIN